MKSVKRDLLIASVSIIIGFIVSNLFMLTEIRYYSLLLISAVVYISLSLGMLSSILNEIVIKCYYKIIVLLLIVISITLPPYASIYINIKDDYEQLMDVANDSFATDVDTKLSFINLKECFDKAYKLNMLFRDALIFAYEYDMQPRYEKYNEGIKTLTANRFVIDNLSVADKLKGITNEYIEQVRLNNIKHNRIDIYSKCLRNAVLILSIVILYLVITISFNKILMLNLSYNKSRLSQHI